MTPIDPSRVPKSLEVLSRRFDLEPMPEGSRPILLLSSGWRAGSTLVQRLLVSDSDLLMWGEPYDHSGLIRRMAESLAPIDEGWPPDAYVVSSSNVPSADRWIANAYPHPQHLIRSHRAFFDGLFVEPVSELGFDRWGVKGVRLHGAHAAYLRHLYPDAIVVMLHRNPYDAFLSYRLLHDIRSHSTWWFHSWPDDAVSDASRFGEIWADLTGSFLEWAPRLGGIVLAYEDLLRGRGVDELAEATGLTLDRSVLERRVGGTRDQRGEWDGAQTTLTADEESAIRATTGSVARGLGYLEPTEGTS